MLLVVGFTLGVIICLLLVPTGSSSYYRPLSGDDLIPPGALFESSNELQDTIHSEFRS